MTSVTVKGRTKALRMRYGWNRTNPWKNEAMPRKMSEVLKEMSEVLLSDPDKPPTSEAAHIALFFANVAWNECVGLDHAREGYRHVWEEIEADNPTLWNEFKSNDIDGMIDELVQYKQTHFPDDKRRILTCGIPDGKIRVEDDSAISVGLRKRSPFLRDRVHG